MAEQDTDVDIEVKAKQMGWVAQEDFKGDPKNWRPAEEFVQRGEEILPIVRKENEKLRQEAAATKAELARIKGLFDASQEAIKELKTFHTEDTARQVERAKRELKAGIKQAKADGDDDLEESLREELTQINAAIAEAPRKQDTTPAPPQPRNDPELIAWKADNPWFETDVKKTALTVAIAEELRADPKNATLLGRPFYERAASEADAILNPRPGRSHSKLEEGGGGGGPRGGNGGDNGPAGRTYRDLPAEARAVCDRQEAKLVGAGRAFKDKTAWRQHYVEQYFLGE